MFANILANAFLQVSQTNWGRRASMEEGPVGFEKCVAAASTNENLSVLLKPLYRVPGRKAKMPPDRRRDGDLALPGEAGLGEFHTYTLPR